MAVYHGGVVGWVRPSAGYPNQKKTSKGERKLTRNSSRTCTPLRQMYAIQGGEFDRAHSIVLTTAHTLDEGGTEDMV